MTNIFADNAARYWSAGLPVIPLIQGTTRPAEDRWQLHCDAFPTAAVQRQLLTSHASGNIGLPLGPASRLVAIDIEAQDEAVLEVLDRVLPQGLWQRHGEGRHIQAYRWSGSERTMRVVDSEGSVIFTLLGKGSQIALPPSVNHKAEPIYTETASLCDVLTKVPSLPFGFMKVLREEFDALGIEFSTSSGAHPRNWISDKSQHSAMVREAADRAYQVIDRKTSLKAALSDLQVWLERQTDLISGEPLTRAHAERTLVDFLINEVTSASRKVLPPGWDDGLTQEYIERLGLGSVADLHSWSKADIEEFLTLKKRAYPDARDQRWLQIVEVVLDRIVRANPPMTQIDIADIFRLAERHTHLVSRQMLENSLKTRKLGNIRGDTHSEIARACLKHLCAFGEVRYEGSNFWQWDGSLWRKIEDSHLRRTVAQRFGAYPAAKRERDHSGIIKVMAAAVTQRVSASAAAGINFANGFLNEHLELKHHAPEQGMSYALPYRFIPEVSGHMPMFAQLLSDCWGHDPDYVDKMQVLQEMIGATLMGSATRYQRAFLLYGQAGAGKSVLTSVVRGLLPNHATSSISPVEWGRKFMPAEMFGKLANFAGELTETRKIAGDRFKTIVSGDMLTVERKGASALAFEPKCAQWFSSNHLPTSDDESEGFTRRWLILEFNRSVRAPDRIVDLDRQILNHEREAIAAWAVEGYRRLQTNGNYTMPASHHAAIEDIAAGNNPVRKFLQSLDSGLVWEPGAWIGRHQLYDIYRARSLAQTSVQAVSIAKFTRMMRGLAGTLAFEIEPWDGDIRYIGVDIDG